MTDTDPTSSAPPRPRRRGTKGTPPAQGNVLGALGETPAPAPEPAPEPAAPAPETPAPEAPAEEAPKGKEKSRKAAKAAKDRTEPLNFRVTVEFRKAFKRAAAAQDCKKVELLERIFTEWQERNPG